MAKGKVLGLGAAAFLAVAAVVLASCGSNVSNPRPTLNSISPTSMLAGSAGFNLTVTGRNFVSGSSVVEWNGSPRTTTFVSDSQLQAIINPSDLAVAGTAGVTVFTQGPGGGASSTAIFTINPQPSPVPTISSISPATALAGGSGLTLIVNGTNFVDRSVVTWNGGNRTTTFFNSTQLTASITSTDVQTAGTAQVAVLNPQPGGGASNSVTVQINNPLPHVASLSPAIAVAGGTAFTLTVNGTGFACAQFTTTNGTTTCSTSASTVNWNGTPRTTTFMNNTQLTASITMADIAPAEIAQVAVTNQAPGGGTSLPAPYPVNPGATGAGLPELVDVSNSGVEAANGVGSVSNAGPAVAGNGRFVVFASDSGNLVPNDFNSAADVFLRDTCLGVTTNCSPSTTLVSVSLDGMTPANGSSSEPSVSASGRFVVFSSAATNLISPSLPAGTLQQIYLRDTCTAVTSCTPATTLVSVGLAADGVTPAPGNGRNSQAFISPDGQFVVFSSTATNFAVTPAIPSGSPQQIYLRNTCAGVTGTCTASTVLVTVPNDGSAAANDVSSQPVIGGSGRFVAFSSLATNLVSIATGGVQQVYWRDTCTGASGCTPTTLLASLGADGISAGNAASLTPSISSDGRLVAFASLAVNLVSPNLSPGTPQQIYLRDTCTGATGCTAGTALVSVASDGVSPGGGDSSQPQVSSNGRFVAFGSVAANLVTTDANNAEDVFVRDTCAGASSCTTPKTVLASVAADGTTQGNGASLTPAISGDGHFVAFLSEASNLVLNDANIAPVRDVFLAISHF